MKRLLPLLICLLFSFAVMAENWDYIRSSGEYYYGMGHGKTEKEAMDQALGELSSMIATHVSNDFTLLEDETNRNGQIDHKSQVLNCIKTYSQTTIRNVDKWTEKKEDDFVAYCYMKRAELDKIYADRIAKAKDMMVIAGESLQKGKVDMALQYYYWAYSLIRSVQRPNEVKDEKGRIIANWIPLKIDEILSNVSVNFEKRDGDCVDLLFNYEDKPVSSLEFTYNDGRTECIGTAKDGRGMIEMIPNYETDTYHVNVEYEYKGQARGDAEMQSVLDVITCRVFPKAAFIVKRKETPPASLHEGEKDQTGVNLKPNESQLAEQSEALADITFKVIDAIKAKNMIEASKYFTFEGKDMFRQLIGYGTGRVVGNPNLKFFKGHNGKVVARGLQMSFSFNRGTKNTFVEDVVFTFNTEKKIENIAFGLGHVAENDILCKDAPGWKNDTREMLMEFLESYKTAYCLKRLDYIKDIFADNAIIIIGNVAKRKHTQNDYQERSISLEGQDIITYNRYTKDEYLKHLEKCFNRNEFINIRFTNNDIQWLEKYKDKELFGIQIGQEYSSTSYGDKGFLYLLVDMTDHDQPQINIRTWQPNEVNMKKIFNSGDFYNE